LDTELIFPPLRNTARVASNAVSREVVEILNRGGEFPDAKDLVAGVRGVRCSRTVTWTPVSGPSAPRWA
jgi:NADH:quinone reductase (non-electrogenic)